MAGVDVAARDAAVLDRVGACDEAVGLGPTDNLEETVGVTFLASAPAGVLTMARCRFCNDALSLSMFRDQ
jgi:hypothetical protein